MLDNAFYFSEVIRTKPESLIGPGLGHDSRVLVNIPAVLREKPSNKIQTIYITKS